MSLPHPTPACHNPRHAYITAFSPRLARLPRETPRAYQAFRTYVDLGADRSLSELGRTQPYLEEWSTKFDWSKRILIQH